jgi:A/G-specific adenine glycosylase
MNGLATTFQKRLLRWYDKHQRKLPWRAPANGAADGRPSPYHVFVSEAMLQQTQVATVIPYFNRFIKELPDFRALADADEGQVLRLWQGLGYYSRARNLHAAAKRVSNELSGRLPRTIDELLKLPGVGRYTAGAIASIAFDQHAPILDGNVARVLCRLDRIETNPRDNKTREILWKRAEEILPSKRLGDFNSAMMELGATVCTPRSPKCLVCPVNEQCEALVAGIQESIPTARVAKARPLVKRWTFCIQHDGRWLIERRPAKGRWAGLWQFVTLEPVAHEHSAHGHLIDAVAAHYDIATSTPKPLGTIDHGLTHRQYEFSVFVCNAKGKISGCNAESRAWVDLDDISRYALPRPHLRVVELLRQHDAARQTPANAR